MASRVSQAASLRVSQAAPVSPNKRKAPSVSATETPIGTVKQGNNGAYWVVLPFNQTARWVEIHKNKPVVYHTETNGSSLRVLVGQTRIYVFYQEVHGATSGFKWLYTSPPYQRLWTSKGTWLVPPRRKTGAAMPRAPKHTTVLLQTGRLTFVHIDGHSIVQFKTSEPIIDYDAPMGNSFLPYAFARTESRVYLLLESKSIPWPPVNAKPNASEDPYDVYYANKTESLPFKKTVLIETW